MSEVNDVKPREDLRTRISIAAQEIFAREGLEGLSMRKLAEKVGVTAPAIYRHFRDKDELINDLIIVGLEKLQTYLQPAMDVEDPYRRLRLLIDYYLDFAIEEPRYFDFAFLMPSHNVRQISEEIERHNWTTFRMSVEQVSTCMATGVFRQDDPLQTCVLIWSTVHGLVTLQRMERFGTDDAQFREIYTATVDRLLQALAPPTADS